MALESGAPASPQARRPEGSEQRQRYEGVGVDLLQEVPLQLEKLEGSHAGEAVRLHELDEVVVQVETHQARQALEQTRVHRR